MSSTSVTIRIPQNILDQLPTARGERSQAIISLLKKGLGLPNTKDSINPLSDLEILRQDVRQLQDTVRQLEDTVLQKCKTIPTTPYVKSVLNSSPLPRLKGWLTSGEAYSEAQRRGYQKTKSSMRRDLRSGGVPADLERLGLVANWKVREQANPKDNSVRWLRFE